MIHGKLFMPHIYSNKDKVQNAQNSFTFLSGIT